MTPPGYLPSFDIYRGVCGPDDDEPECDDAMEDYSPEICEAERQLEYPDDDRDGDEWDEGRGTANSPAPHAA